VNIQRFRLLLPLLALSGLLAAFDLPWQDPQWHKVPAITVIARENDPRLPAVPVALQPWSAYLRLRRPVRRHMPDHQSALASLTWRYIGSVSEDNNSGDPTLHFATFGGFDFYNATIPSFSYLDLEATWNVNSVLQIRAGANNILDKDPPVIDSGIVSGGAANTYSIYDMFGRQLFVAFTAKF
jgi:outer membrane receptor protein involved in Fe transport